MRLLLSVLVLAVAGLVPVSAVRAAVAGQELDYRAAGARVGVQFMWPADDRVADPVAGYDVLAGAAADSGVNVVRMSTASSSAGRARVAYFVFLGRSDSGLFDRFGLASGRWLTPGDVERGDAVVATAGVGLSDAAGEAGPAVVGVPRVWGGGFDLSFEPLERAFRSLPMAGTYAVDAGSEADADRFLAVVGEHLAGAGVPGGLVVAGAAGAGDGGRAAAGGRYAPALLAGLLVVLVTAAAARDGRRIGAMLLLGFPPSRVWRLIAGRLVAGAGAVGALAGLAVLWRTSGADAVLAARLALPLAGGVCLAGAVTAGLAVVLVRRVRISDLVKGRVS